MGVAPAVLSQAPVLSGDQANCVVSGAFAGTGQSASFMIWGPFNVFIYGDAGPGGAWNGLVRLERSFDGGTTWIICNVGGDGTQATWPAAAGAGFDVSVVVGEPEKGIAYRLNCVTFTSGPINYRMSASSQAALSLAVSSML